jgi:hypothetical protein
VKAKSDRTLVSALSLKNGKAATVLIAGGPKAPTISLSNVFIREIFSPASEGCGGVYRDRSGTTPVLFGVESASVSTQPFADKPRRTTGSRGLIGLGHLLCAFGRHALTGGARVERAI